MTVHNELSTGDLEPVAQFMIDENYDFLVYNGDAGESFDQVDSVGGDGIYGAKGEDDD